MKSLSCDNVIAGIRRHKRDFERNYGVTRIGVFGSVARNEANDSSDVDIVVEMPEPDLFYLVHIKDTLSQEFECPVDVVTRRDSMNQYLKSRILDEAVYA
jgi:predicted nucleotidyltransferase